jgi:hypothetical protein
LFLNFTRGWIFMGRGAKFLPANPIYSTFCKRFGVAG